MLKGLKRLAAGALLLRQGIQELRGLRLAAERIATAIERANADTLPAPHLAQTPREGQPPVAISYVDDQEQADLMAIELDLTNVRGIAPSEDEVLAEYERRHPIPLGLQ